MKKIMVLIFLMLLSFPAFGQWFGSNDAESRPRGVTIATLGEGETVYVGALTEGRRLIAAEYIRIRANEALTVTFNGGPVLIQSASEDVIAKLDSDYSVTDAIPIAANEWYIIKCSATQLTLTDCDGGTATIIAEY